MSFEILGQISDVETFAAGSGIREIARLRRLYGARSLAQAQRYCARPIGGWFYSPS